jgi:hypothetical protein
MKLYRLYFHVPTSGKNNFVWYRGVILQHLNGVSNLLSKTSMKVVKFSVFVWISILLPIFKVAFLSFQKPVCMVFSAHFFDGGFFAFPLYKRRLFYCRVLHRLHLQYIMVEFHKTLELCSVIIISKTGK